MRVPGKRWHQWGRLRYDSVIKIIRIWNNIFNYLNCFRSPFSFISKSKTLSLVFKLPHCSYSNESTCHVSNACRRLYVLLAYFWSLLLMLDIFTLVLQMEKLRLRRKLITQHTEFRWQSQDSRPCSTPFISLNYFSVKR